MAKYSYIIPFYNVKPYVAECLDSVLAQTYPDWECICVDDGSPDGLGKILDEYASRDSRITVIHQKNAGVGAARNAALEKITGDWFIVLDGDDVASPYTCEFCEFALKRYPNVDMIMGHDVKFPEKGVCEWANSLCVDDLLEFRDVHDVVDMWSFAVGHQARAYRSSVFRKFRYPHTVRGQDRCFLLDCVFAVKTIVRVDFAVFGYRERLGSTTRSLITKDKLLASIYLAKHLVNLIDGSSKRVSRSLIRTQLNRFMEEIISEWYSLKNKGERKQVLMEWVKTLRLISRSKRISWFIRLRAKFITWIPLRPIIYLLCLVPYKIKLMGLHR